MLKIMFINSFLSMTKSLSLGGFLITSSAIAGGVLPLLTKTISFDTLKFI